MSHFRREAIIDAPLRDVWELVGNPARFPQWWPRVVEVRGQSFEQDARFAQVTKTPVGRTHETTLVIETKDELQEIGMRCLDTGVFARWRLAEAQGETFVRLEMGMDPASRVTRVFDATMGRLYFRRWADESIDALKRAAT